MYDFCTFNSGWVQLTLSAVLMDETFYGKISAGNDGNGVYLFER